MKEAPDLRRNVTKVRIAAVSGGVRSVRPDRLATEEPMEIRAGGPGQEAVPVAVTMRTPGGDFELAVGFLLTEGLIHSAGDVEKVSYCEDLDDAEQQYNVVTVNLTREFDTDSLKRNFYATSSCGVCGKATLQDLEVRCEPVAPGPNVSPAVINSLPASLRKGQKVFEETGGLHAAGLFDRRGKLQSVREDVGRHNAVDKVIGEALLDDRLPLDGSILQVSGRVSFEIVQKAAVAGIPILSAVSAPSSLAVEAAEDFGMTVIGFVRHDRFNVYSHRERLFGAPVPRPSTTAITTPAPRPAAVSSNIEDHLTGSRSGGGHRSRSKKFVYSRRITRGLILLAAGLGLGIVALSQFCLPTPIVSSMCLLGKGQPAGEAIASAVVAAGVFELFSGIRRGLGKHRSRRPVKKTSAAKRYRAWRRTDPRDRAEMRQGRRRRRNAAREERAARLSDESEKEPE